MTKSTSLYRGNPGIYPKTDPHTRKLPKEDPSPLSLMGMNHACISVNFSVLFLVKMHDSYSFSLILC